MTGTMRKRFFAVLGQFAIDGESRHEYISEWTNGRTASSADLTDSEAMDIINRLEGRTRMKTKRYSDNCDRLRKQLIAMSYSIGEQPMFVKVWSEKYGAKNGTGTVRRRFNDYTEMELYRLRDKFRKVVDDRQMAVTRIRRER